MASHPHENDRKSLNYNMLSKKVICFFIHIFEIILMIIFLTIQNIIKKPV